MPGPHADTARVMPGPHADIAHTVCVKPGSHADTVCVKPGPHADINLKSKLWLACSRELMSCVGRLCKDYLYLLNSTTQRQLSATNPNSTTHNGSQHRSGWMSPTPIRPSLRDTWYFKTNTLFGLECNWNETFYILIDCIQFLYPIQCMSKACFLFCTSSGAQGGRRHHPPQSTEVPHPYHGLHQIWPM